MEAGLGMTLAVSSTSYCRDWSSTLTAPVLVEPVCLEAQRRCSKPPAWVVGPAGSDGTTWHQFQSCGHQNNRSWIADIASRLSGGLRVDTWRNAYQRIRQGFADCRSPAEIRRSPRCIARPLRGIGQLLALDPPSILPSQMWEGTVRAPAAVRAVLGWLPVLPHTNVPVDQSASAARTK
jgi:hypothetical protein